jgi:toxin YoeB
VKLLWAADAWEDYVHWQQTDAAVLAMINLLLTEIRPRPYAGLGKPEPLKGNLSGWWSRRITGEHRLVYRVAGAADAERVEIVQCRFHY